MARAIIGGIVGYLIMAVIVMGVFTVAYQVMGADGAFKPGVWEVSTAWLVMSFAVGLGAAVLGGLVCALIAKPGSKASMVLAVVVLLLGAAESVYGFMGRDEAPVAREGEVSLRDAMTRAEPPTVSLLLNPVIGAAGILIGARLRGGGRSPAAV